MGKGGGREAGAANYKDPILIFCVELHTPTDNIGWGRVVRDYERLSEDGYPRDPKDIRKKWRKLVAQKDNCRAIADKIEEKRKGRPVLNAILGIIGAFFHMEESEDEEEEEEEGGDYGLAANAFNIGYYFSHYPPSKERWLELCTRCEKFNQLWHAHKEEEEEEEQAASQGTAFDGGDDNNDVIGDNVSISHHCLKLVCYSKIQSIVLTT